MKITIINSKTTTTTIKPTTTTTIKPTTIKPTTTTEPDDGLPDYNDLQYDFSCSGGKCTITVENGMTFVGEEKNGVVSFRSIPYALPPVGERRWKGIVINTMFSTIYRGL